MGARLGERGLLLGRMPEEAVIVRTCLTEPIQAIFAAAETLSSAVDAHLAGARSEAARLFAEANDPVVWSYTDAAWGAGAKARYGFIEVPNAPPLLSTADRPTPRMPDKGTRRAVIARDGYLCRFCGIPVIDPDIRKLLKTLYPEAISWGSTNATQHDHILPNGRGGASAFDNVVVTCAPCNFGRMEATIEEARLAHPLLHPTPRRWSGFEQWDGLERVRQLPG